MVKVTTHKYGIGKMTEEIDNATLEMMRQAAVQQTHNPQANEKFGSHFKRKVFTNILQHWMIQS